MKTVFILTFCSEFCGFLTERKVGFETAAGASAFVANEENGVVSSSVEEIEFAE